MKKIMMVGLMLTMMVAVQAQVKVAPKMAKCMQKVYVTESKVGIPGQPEFNMTAETKYSVTGAVKGGYTMEVVTTDFKCDATDNNIAAKLMSAPSELLKGVTIRVTTDEDGHGRHRRVPTGLRWSSLRALEMVVAREGLC